MKHRIGERQILIYPDSKWSVGIFSCSDLDCVRAVLAAAEKESSPVGLCIDADLVAPKAIPSFASAVMSAAESAAVPVEVVFSHPRSLESVQVALDLGFPAILFDGSFLPFARNVGLTADAAAMAHRVGVTIEGKIGAFGDFGKDSSGRFLMDELAEKFVRDTAIDSLAVSMAMADDQTCCLDLERLASLRRRLTGGLSLDDATRLAPQDILAAVAADVTPAVLCRLHQGGWPRGMLTAGGDDSAETAAFGHLGACRPIATLGGRDVGNRHSNPVVYA